MTTVVVGAGSWGTALAKLLHRNGHRIVLWGRDPEKLERIRSEAQNARYLPGVALPKDLILESNLKKACAGASCAIIAVPSPYLRSITEQLNDFSGIALSVTKGIEYDTGLTMSGILRQTMPGAKVAALSGPTLAMEVARGIPAAGVVASDDGAVAGMVQSLFHSPTFRIYTSTDLLGVELGGALKNVIAIAAGVSDGLGFGDNSKAALITRGIVEMRRLGVACGAHAETFAGLSGLGDLTVTCFSRLSRNRAFGEQLGKGETLKDIAARTVTVAEGYPTAQSAVQLARKRKVETPIAEAVYSMLYRGKHIAAALRDLMSRDLKPED